MQNINDWQIALYGVLAVLSMGVIQFFITNYFQKAEKRKDERIEEIFTAISELNANVKLLTQQLNDHAIQIALCKEKFSALEKQVSEHEKRLNTK